MLQREKLRNTELEKEVWKSLRKDTYFPVPLGTPQNKDLKIVKVIGIDLAEQINRNLMRSIMCFLDEHMLSSSFMTCTSIINPLMKTEQQNPICS